MNIQLTISMLVSDRMATLGKCLASLKPLLSELDSELIVVFTGKNEETLNLVRQYTSQIIPFEWCNDFSKARNAGLKAGRGEWFLYLDDDEWFEDTAEIIRFFKSGEYRHYQSACYVARNYLDFEGKTYSDGDVGRMCRLTPDTEFIFPIHENLSPFEEPCKRMSAFVHHFGYAHKNLFARKDSRPSRNLPLLLEMYEQDPDSPRCCMQIAQEYRSVGDFGKAVEFCREGLSLAREGEQILNCELWLQVNLPLLISYTGDLKLALKEGEDMLKHPRTLDAGALHLSVTLTSICRELKEYRKGLKYVRLYREKLAYLMERPEKAMYQRAAGLTLEKAMQETVPVYVDGLYFAAEVGDFQMARQLLSWIPWDDEKRVAPHYPRLEEWKKICKSQRDAILTEYGRLNTENSYVRIQKVLFEENQGHLQEAETLWNRCAKDCPAGFLWELMEIAVRNGFLLEPLLNSMSPEVWDGYAETVTKQKDWGNMQEFYREIMPMLDKYPFYQRRLEQYFLEKGLNTGQLEPSALTERLLQYCTSVCTDALTLYRTEALADPAAYALPTRYRFAVVMKEALRMIEDGRPAESFPFLNEAIHIFPGMSSAISQLLQHLEEQKHLADNGVPEEFQVLGTQVKQVLRGLIDAKQWDEAYGVAAKLLPLLPDDLEVLQMKQEILRQGTDGI